MPDKPRDAWDKLDLLVRIIASILIPWTIFCYTDASTHATLEIQNSTAVREREFKIISMISSDSLSEISAGVHYGIHLIERREANRIISGVAGSIYNSTDNRTLQTALLPLIETVNASGASPSERSVAKNLLSKKTIYIQIFAESQRRNATILQQSLRNNDFIAPGIENVGDDKGPRADPQKDFEIRYYADGDKIFAEEIKKIAEASLDMTADPKLIPGYSRSLPIEVWFPALK